jgi:hypothetical protein
MKYVRIYLLKALCGLVYSSAYLSMEVGSGF